MRYLVGSCWLVCLFLATACQSDQPAAVVDSEARAAAQREAGPGFQLQISGDTAHYEQLVLAKEVEPFGEEAQVTQIRLSYPKITDFKAEEVKDSINAVIYEIMLLNDAGEIAYDNLQQRLDAFIREYEMAKEEMKKQLVLPNRWTCEVEIKVVLNSNRILSLQLHEANFTGGAHPNSFTRYFNFDLKTAKLLALEDIFVEGYQQELLQTAERYFRMEREIPAKKSMGETDYEFPGGRFLLPRNFALRRGGIVFCFNPYDIAPYSMGTIEFELPYQAILPILKQEAVL